MQAVKMTEKAAFRKHRVVGMLLASVLGLAVIEGLLLLYYLSSWLTLPL